MKQGNQPLTITYAVGYALTNSTHSIHFMDRDNIYLDELFKENTKVRIISKDVKKKHESIFPLTKQPRLKEIIEEKEIIKINKVPKEESKYENLQKQIQTINNHIRDIDNKI